MIVPDNTKQALTIKRVKYQKSESSQPRIAACKGCGDGGSGIVRGSARRMPRHESMFTHDRANGMSDYANRVQRHAASVRARIGVTLPQYEHAPRRYYFISVRLNIIYAAKTETRMYAAAVRRGTKKYPAATSP